MPLVNMNNMLEQAQKEHYGVGSFDVFNIEMLKGVLDAAEETRSPVILAYAEVFEELVSIESFAPVMVRMAQNATVPVAVHLDHAATLEFILRAVHNGFTSVMIDASEKPFKDNVTITNQVMQICRTFDVSVEAELGHVSGGEGLYKEDEYIYTDVKEAKQFVDETDVDALAVAIGTVHGVYKSTPKLSIDRLKAIKETIHKPIVLHGGSGLSDKDFQNTIVNGVSKVNIFTDLMLAAQQSIRSQLSDNTSFLKQCINIADAVKDEAIKKIMVFGSNGKAD
jgi:fructose-bisphosphate aldolase class II